MMVIIGITGTQGAGKGAVVKYLVEKKGFSHASARQLLVEEIERRGMEINRDNMLVVANDLRKKHSAGYITQELMARASMSGTNYVIESLRAVTEVLALKEYPHSFLFAVDADAHKRYERVVLRKSETDQVSFETFVEHERKESVSSDPKESNVQSCIKLADHVFINNGSLEDLYKEIEIVLTTKTPL